MFQRFTVVMEYQLKPVLPPPIIAFCHFYSLLKYLIRKAKGTEEYGKKSSKLCFFTSFFTICINFLIVGSQGPRDNGLKLFLEREDMERLYDFEEECVEGYFREQEKILNQSTEEKIGNTKNKVEHMAQKIEDINQKENIQTVTVQVLFCHIT